VLLERCIFFNQFFYILESGFRIWPCGLHRCSNIFSFFRPITILSSSLFKSMRSSYCSFLVAVLLWYHSVVSKTYWVPAKPPPVNAFSFLDFRILYIRSCAIWFSLWDCGGKGFFLFVPFDKSNFWYVLNWFFRGPSQGHRILFLDTFFLISRGFDGLNGIHFQT
jgi:hypothetical protein